MLACRTVRRELTHVVAAGLAAQVQRIGALVLAGIGGCSICSQQPCNVAFPEKQAGRTQSLLHVTVLVHIDST